MRFHDRLMDRRDIRYNPAVGGGVVYDMGCYAISFIRHFMGREPQRVDSILNYGESGVDESALLSMVFEDNSVTAGAYLSLNSRTDCSRTIVGETGIIIIPLFFNVAGENKSIMLKKPKGVDKIALDCRNPYQAEAEQFAACVLRGEKPVVSPEFSIGNAAVIEKALRKG